MRLCRQRAIGLEDDPKIPKGTRELSMGVEQGSGVVRCEFMKAPSHIIHVRVYYGDTKGRRWDPGQRLLQ